jgi:hypothetical protein
MSVDVSRLAQSMIDTARSDVAGRWPKLAALAEPELRRLAQSLVDVAGLVASGAIEEASARQLVHMHQVAARSVLLTIQGIGLLTAERAIQAGVRAAAGTVNGMVKLTLL